MKTKHTYKLAGLTIVADHKSKTINLGQKKAQPLTFVLASAEDLIKYDAFLNLEDEEKKYTLTAHLNSIKYELLASSEKTVRDFLAQLSNPLTDQDILGCINLVKTHIDIMANDTQLVDDLIAKLISVGVQVYYCAKCPDCGSRLVAYEETKSEVVRLAANVFNIKNMDTFDPADLPGEYCAEEETVEIKWICGACGHDYGDDLRPHLALFDTRHEDDTDIIVSDPQEDCEEDEDSSNVEDEAEADEEHATESN